MIYKLCRFRDTLEEDTPILGGIAIYEDYCQGTVAPYYELVGVICGECGSFIEAEDVEIIEVIENWWSISEAILDNCAPDGMRGFRPENQISMDFPDDADKTGFNPYIGTYDYDC